MKEDSVEVFRIQAGRYLYYAKVVTQYSHRTPFLPESYGIDFGGKMKGCVRITVLVPNNDIKDERFLDLEKDKRVAKISWIGYSPKCSIQADLLSGEGTRHMVRTAMTYVLDTFCWIDKFSLTDKSKVSCVEGLKVSLPHMSIATNGKTYYEKYFHAYLDLDSVRTSYQECIAKFTDPKEKLSWRQFHDKYRIPEEHISDIRTIYEKSGTYTSFFQALRKHCISRDISFCKIINPWVDALVDDMLVNRRRNFFGMTWIIDKDKVTKTTISKMTVANSGAVLADFQEQFKEYDAFVGGACSGCLGPADL